MINPIFAAAALRYVFALAPSCEVIHGTIYTCLRAMFGLSVIGILVSIFSCMLVYQILRCVTRDAVWLLVTCYRVVTLDPHQHH